MGGRAEPRAGDGRGVRDLALSRLPDRHLPRGPREHPGAVLRGREARWCVAVAALPQDHAAAVVAADLLRLHDREHRRAARLQRDLRAHEWRAARHDAHGDDERVPHVLPAGSDRARLGDGRAADAPHPRVHAHPVPGVRASRGVRMSAANVLPRAAARTPARPVTRVAPSTVVKHAVLILTGALVAYPFYFMLTASVKGFFEASVVPPTIFPRELHFENYVTAWGM